MGGLLALTRKGDEVHAGKVYMCGGGGGEEGLCVSFYASFIMILGLSFIKCSIYKIRKHV